MYDAINIYLKKLTNKRACSGGPARTPLPPSGTSLSLSGEHLPSDLLPAPALAMADPVHPAAVDQREVGLLLLLPLSSSWTLS